MLLSTQLEVICYFDDIKLTKTCRIKIVFYFCEDCIDFKSTQLCYAEIHINASYYFFVFNFKRILLAEELAVL